MNIELKILDKKFYPVVETTCMADEKKQWRPMCKPLPDYATTGSAGIDLVATKDYSILPQQRIKIATGIAVHIGTKQQYDLEGFPTAAEILAKSMSVMGMIVPRSGLGTKGLILANTIGIIDEDYQGEIIISARNSLPDSFHCHTEKSIHYKTSYAEENTISIKAGYRIAQMVFVPVIKAVWSVVEEFTHTSLRGSGAFGHTGE